MRRPKIVVVGAGPSGAVCALSLARSGRADVVLLDKSKYPRVKVCGSGLSPHGLNMLQKLDLLEQMRPLHTPIAGVVAQGPGGTRVRLRGAKGAWVVPRVELDATIVTAAERAGAQFFEDTKVVELLRNERGNVCGVKTTEGAYEADLVVCATGSPSRFSEDSSPKIGIRTIMGWWKGVALEQPDEAVMVWDRRLAGYYLWAFPEPHGIVNIGLTIPDEAPEASRLKDLFRELLDEHFGVELRGAEQVGKWMGHPATVTTKVAEVAQSHVLWTGEAARLVSPGTAEGIAFAMESGDIAARIVSRHYDLERGLSPHGRTRYRAELAMRMLPKFWAGEAFVRGMKSERVRSLSAKVFDPQNIGAYLTKILGEQPLLKNPVSQPEPRPEARSA